MGSAGGCGRWPGSARRSSTGYRKSGRAIVFNTGLLAGVSLLVALGDLSSVPWIFQPAVRRIRAAPGTMKA
ncbi:hypothetical protein ACWEGE_02880 [Amycolatopsis sp. NPDC004747]